MTQPVHELLRELHSAQQELPVLPPAPALPEALRPGRGRRVSEAWPAWLLQLPAVHALAPWGRMRLARLFRSTPTHPDSARLDAALIEWALRSGLFHGAMADKAAEARIGYLVYWAAPLGSLPVLWPMGTLTLWLLAVDDSMIERGVPIGDLKRACDDLIRSGQTSHPMTPASRYWLELRREVIALGGGELLPQIADAERRYFGAGEQEQRYIKDDGLPSLAEYVKQRIRIFGMHATMLVQRCERGLLPPHRSFCDRLRWLADLANLIQALDNDIVGYQRDIEANFPMNIILVLSLEFRADLATGYLMSLDLLEMVKHIFDALVEDVCANPGPCSEAAAQARAIAAWPDAFHTYHETNGRYKREPAVDPAAAVPQDHDWRSGPLLRALAPRDKQDAATPANQERRGSWQQWVAALFGWSPLENPAFEE